MIQDTSTEVISMRRVEWKSYTNESTQYVIGDESTAPKLKVNYGYFHRWIDSINYGVSALVELGDGTLTEVDYNNIKFI